MTNLAKHSPQISCTDH